MIDKSELITWLKGIDKKLKKDIVLVAVGGTAMTLLGLKSSTIDIDFCLSNEDKELFKKVLDNKFKVDIFVDGYIFSEQLPEDFIDKAKEITKMKNITLKTLSPVDIVITKTARFNARDEEDIKSLARYVDKEELLTRFEQVVDTYSGSEKNYRMNFEIVIKRFFAG